MDAEAHIYCILGSEARFAPADISLFTCQMSKKIHVESNYDLSREVNPSGY